MIDNNTKSIRGISTEESGDVLINAKYWEGFNVEDLKTIGGKSILKESITDDNNIEIHTNSILDITYSELKTLRDNSELQTGTQYRITDYVTTTVQENTKSANHPFEIIVTATSTNMLSEVASACWIKRTNRIEINEEMTPGEWSNVEVNDIPEELKTKLSFEPTENTDIKCFTTLVTLNEGVLDVEFKFKPGSGSRKINCVGVDVVKINDGNEEVISYDYHIGYTGDAHVNNSYALTVTECGEYKIRYFVDNKAEGINATSYITSVNIAVLDYDYFDNRDLSAWEIKYCLDNDTNRFAWADEENGKGVIYYMKDEYGNECSYDFKNIMFNRNSGWVKTHQGEDKFSSLNAFVFDEDDNNTEVWFYTFSNIDGTTITDDSLNQSLSNNYPCRYNIILPYSKRDRTNGVLKHYLNNNIFIGNGAEYNHFGENSCDNTFIEIYNNYFDMACQKNIAYKTLHENHIGINFKNNTITNDFIFNNINNNCDSNTFGYFCYCNVKNNFKSNLLNIFESCTIGNDFFSNELNSFKFCVVGDGFMYNNSITSDLIKYCEFGNYIQWCSDLPSMTNVVFDNEVVKNSDEGKGLTNIVLSNGENALTVISNLSNNTSKVLFTKRNGVYCLIDIAQNIEEFEGKLECIYDLGRFSTNGEGENAAFNIDIIRNPKILYLKFYNIEKQKNIYIKQFIYNHNCSNGEYGYAKQYMYLDGITYCRKCWFKNGENGYETVNNSEYNSGWKQFEDRDGLLYSGGHKVVTRNDNDVFVKLSGDQTISGIKRFNNNINIAGKTIIRSDINNGELKVFKPEETGSTNAGFIIRTNETHDGNSIPKLELLGTNNSSAYIYQFPKLKNANATDYVVVNSQLADYAKASDLNDVIEEVKENEKVTAVALNNLNEISENINNISNSLNVSYSELVELRNTSSLVPGKQYRIIDYVTTTSQIDTESAGHLFDIIVTADDNSTLNEVARAGYSSVDHYFEDYKAKLEAWKIWYCLDNDKKRFAWADDNGKGVIYRMIDEWNNDCPYDFKNIMFIRYINPSVGVSIVQNGGLRSLCYTFSIYSGNSIKDYSVYKPDNDTFDNFVYNNVIGRRNEFEGIQKLNNNVFFNEFSYGNGACYGNNLCINCYDNTFCGNCYNNTFGNYCHNNTFGNNCGNNTFGHNCGNNTFGNYCRNNTFGNFCVRIEFINSDTVGGICNCNFNTFGHNCDNIVIDCGHSNSFAVDCSSIQLGSGCNYNVFNNNCSSIKMKKCSYNFFGIDCGMIYFDDNAATCNYNTFGNYCENFYIYKSNCSYNTFGNNCYQIVIDKYLIKNSNFSNHVWRFKPILDSEITDINVLSGNYDDKRITSISSYHTIGMNSSKEVKSFNLFDKIN